jgi:hypothetical protein
LITIIVSSIGEFLIVQGHRHRGTEAQRDGAEVKTSHGESGKSIKDKQEGV